MKLKPCPFCATLAKIHRNTFKINRWTKYSVICNYCTASTAWYATKEKASIAWDRRVK